MKNKIGVDRVNNFATWKILRDQENTKLTYRTTKFILKPTILAGFYLSIYSSSGRYNTTKPSRQGHVYNTLKTKVRERR
jgi:hypothetical protein